MLTRNKHGRICVDGCRLRPLHAPGRKREAAERAGAGEAGEGCGDGEYPARM